MKAENLPISLKSYIDAENTTLLHQGNEWDIELSSSATNPWSKFLPADALIIANNGCGDYLYLQKDTESSTYSPVVYVYWHEVNMSEEFADHIDQLVIKSPPEATDHKTIYYSGGDTDVRLGDEVSARDLFIRKAGRVVYVPGISKRNWEMEHDGLSWIGIKFKGGTFSGAYVDPDSNEVKKSVKFIRRNDADIEELGPEEKLE